MTTKHFIKIAEIIKVNKNKPKYVNKIENLSRDLALYFGRENPRFKRDLFLKGCGGEE